MSCTLVGKPIGCPPISSHITRYKETQQEGRKNVVDSLREKNTFRTSQRAKRERGAACCAPTQGRRGPLSPLFHAVSLIVLFSPPFLAFFVWKKFLQSPTHLERPQWKTIVEWIAILSASGCFVVWVIAFLTIPCDVGRYGWGCVARWRSFSGSVVRVAPLFIILAALGRRGTRILSVLWIIAVKFDCLMVDMMA